MTHLNVLRQAGRLDLWSEARIGYGSEREAAICAAMAEAKVALLLLSANFFSSEELLDSILPQLLAKQAQSNLTIIPVLAKACAWQADNRLAKLEIFPNDHRPIWGGDPGRVDETLAELAVHLAGTLGLPPVIPAKLRGQPESGSHGSAASPNEHQPTSLQSLDSDETDRRYRRSKRQRRPDQGPRWWCTRSDPFAELWPEAERQLTQTPDLSAKALFERIQQRSPDQFDDNQLRTFQRRVRAWRMRYIGQQGEQTEPQQQAVPLL